MNENTRPEYVYGSELHKRDERKRTEWRNLNKEYAQAVGEYIRAVRSDANPIDIDVLELRCQRIRARFPW